MNGRHEQCVDGQGGGFGPGAMAVTFATGDALALRARQCTVQLVEPDRNVPGFVMIAIEQGGAALFVGHDPLRARQIAAALLIAADELDGGKGRQ